MSMSVNVNGGATDLTLQKCGAVERKEATIMPGDNGRNGVTTSSVGGLVGTFAASQAVIGISGRSVK